MSDITTKTTVGFLTQKIILLLDLKLEPGDIKLLPGDVQHIKEKRLDCFNNHKDKIPKIIEDPDYVGTNPKYPNSVEYVKKFEYYILVAVILRRKKDLCVITMFDVTDSKINTMLKYGRIKRPT